MATLPRLRRRLRTPLRRSRIDVLRSRRGEAEACRYQTGTLHWKPGSVMWMTPDLGTRRNRNLTLFQIRVPVRTRARWVAEWPVASWAWQQSAQRAFSGPPVGKAEALPTETYDSGSTKSGKIGFCWRSVETRECLQGTGHAMPVMVIDVTPLVLSHTGLGGCSIPTQGPSTRCHRTHANAFLCTWLLLHRTTTRMRGTCWGALLCDNVRVMEGAQVHVATDL